MSDDDGDGVLERRGVKKKRKSSEKLVEMVLYKYKEQQQRQQQRRRRARFLSLNLSDACEPVRRGGGRRSTAFPSSSVSSAASDRDERQHAAPQHQVKARCRREGARRRGLEDADRDGGRRSSSRSGGRSGGSGGARRSGGGGLGGGSSGSGGGSFLAATAASDGPFQRPRLPVARRRDLAQRDRGDARQGERQKVPGAEGVEGSCRGLQGARRAGTGVEKGLLRHLRGCRAGRGGLRRRGLCRGAEPLVELDGCFYE